MYKAAPLLVYLKKGTKSLESAPAIFAESILDELRNVENVGGDVSNEIFVDYQMDDRGMILSGAKTRGDRGVLLRRPPFCPIKGMDSVMKGNLPQEIKSRGVNIGVSMILESSDNSVLITRRSKAMRTFPHVWVPPGGHIEPGETLLQAGQRELKEETGIELENDDQYTVLGFWESSFPPKLHMGLPRRHHIVAYFHKRTNETAATITKKMKLDKNEADACTWLCSCLAHKIVLTDSQFGSHIDANTKCCSSSKLCWSHQDHIDGILIDDNEKIHQGRVIPTPPLFWRADGVEDNERVSTGTKYALKLWLAANNFAFY